MPFNLIEDSSKFITFAVLQSTKIIDVFETDNNKYLINAGSECQPMIDIQASYDNSLKKWLLLEENLTALKKEFTVNIFKSSKLKMENLDDLKKYFKSMNITRYKLETKRIKKIEVLTTLETSSGPIIVPKLKPTKTGFDLENLSELSIKAYGRISNVLSENFNPSFLPIDLNKKSYKFPDKISLINYGLIYCNLIDEQYFGHTKAQILKVVPINSDTTHTGDVVSFFDNPQYYPVNKTRITEIKISIRDLVGDKIKFENVFSTVICKLHFKKV